MNIVDPTEEWAMIAVLVCAIVTLGLIFGLLAGIATGVFRARGAIVAALCDDAMSPRVRSRGGMPVRPVLA